MVTRRVQLQFQASIRGSTRLVNGGDPCSEGDGAQDDGGRLVISAGKRALTAVKGFPSHTHTERERERERVRLHDGEDARQKGESQEYLQQGRRLSKPSECHHRVHFPRIGRRSLPNTSALSPG